MKKYFFSFLFTLSLCAQSEEKNVSNPTIKKEMGSVVGEENSSQELNLTEACKADLVMVIKSKRKLYLSNKGKILKSYTIALGGNAEGHKKVEGDKKTPEGYYQLDYLKTDSAFYKALHISYPNANDIANAKKAGVSPGGQIMLHGQPNGQGWFKSFFKQYTNWTAGCIALHNDEMDEVLKLVEVGTPIVIKP